jgi:hypothetical protein
VADLLGAISWPIVVLLLVKILREPLTALLLAVAKRLEDENTDFSATAAGVSITHHQQAVEGRLEVIQTQQEQIRSMVLPKPAEANLGFKALAPEVATPAAVIERLKGVVAQYESNSLPDDKRQRLHLRNELADQLGIAIYTFKLRDAIFSGDAGTAMSNGWIVGFASSIVLGPRAGDADVLLKIAPHATLKHTKYRVALAIIQLASEAGALTAQQRGGFERSLEVYEAQTRADRHPDESLIAILLRASAVLNTRLT